MLTDRMLRENILAGAPWAADWDVPDPVGWRDICFAPDTSIAAVIRGRLAADAAPARCHTLPLPKGYGKGYRQVAIVDPFDQVVFRSIVALFAVTIDGALDGSVHSYRLIHHGLGWRVKNYRYAHRDRSYDVRLYAADRSVQGMAQLDVREYYPSIEPSRLADVLASIGISGLNVALLARYLGAWNSMWGVTGLPIGPEASGLLGNAFLVPVDRCLRNAGVRFSRYSDDYRLFIRDDAEFAGAAELVCQQMALLGLTLNESKKKYVPRSQMLSFAADPVLDKLGSLLRRNSSRAASEVRKLLENEVSSGQPNDTRVRFCVTALSNKGDPFGLSLVQKDLSLLDVDPKRWGRYIGELHKRGIVDVGWLASVAGAEPTMQTAAAQIHLLRACAKGRLGTCDAGPIERLASSCTRTWTPVRCAAAEVWARSDNWKVTKAVDAALGVGDAQQRRALILTLRHADQSPARDKALAQARVAIPEARPAAEWIEGGAPRVEATHPATLARFGH